jgi:pimeloyl-ACP methyl ester carboxylesterase
MQHEITIDGRTVRYLDSGEGRPLLLIHAFPLTADLWRLQAAALPSGWRLIAPDLRGFGGSSRRAGDTTVAARSIDDHAIDALALLDRLGIERAVVGGLSMGGYVTFAIHRRAAHRVQALVLADTRAEADTDEARGNRDAMLASLKTGGPAAVADAMLPKLLAPATLRDRPEIAVTIRRTIEAADPEGIADAITCLKTRPDSTPLLSRIAVPVLLVVGRDDVLTPVALHETMHATLPGASLTVIEGAGHLSNLERPDVFNRTLARFLHAVAAGAA